MIHSTEASLQDSNKAVCPILEERQPSPDLSGDVMACWQVARTKGNQIIHVKYSACSLHIISKIGIKNYFHITTVSPSQKF